MSLTFCPLHPLISFIVPIRSQCPNQSDPPHFISYKFPLSSSYFHQSNRFLLQTGTQKILKQVFLCRATIWKLELKKLQSQYSRNGNKDIYRGSRIWNKKRILSRFI
jgi:hypothetical protein